MAETKISINRQNCLGCSLCQSVAPDIFEIDDSDGLVKLKKNQFSESDVLAVQKAATDCPNNAINIKNT